MSAQILRRPSTYVVLCALVVVSAFVANGDLRIDTTASEQRADRSSQPKVVRANRAAQSRQTERVMVFGRVLDALGYAVAGAEVNAVAGGKTTTGSNGRFRLSLASAAFADLWVRGKGYSTRWMRASLDSPDPLVVQLETEAPWDVEPTMAARPLLTGEGTVRREDGAPLVGAYVTAAGSGLWSRTDEIGRYTLPLYGPEATLLVQGSDGGVAGRSKALTLGRERGVVPLPELIAEDGGMIRGVLSDAEGNAVEGVPIVVAGEGVSRVCESGTSGRFHIRGLLPGRYEVRPHPFCGSFGRSQELVLDRPTVDCELTLEPLQPRKVQICHENGSPVSNAYIAVILAGTRSVVMRADGDGWVEVSFAPDAVKFEVRTEDGASQFAVRGFDSERTRLLVASP